MLISESIHFVDSDASSDFRGTIVPQASQYADLALVSGTPSSVGPHKCIINSVRILGIQDINWRVEFYGKSYATVANTASQFSGLTGSSLIGWSDHLSTTTNVPGNWVGIHATTATLYGSTTYASYISGLNMPYEDRDGTGRLHVNLVNMSNNLIAGATKSAGDLGLLHLRVGVVYAS